MAYFLGLCFFSFMFITFIWSTSNILNVFVKMFFGCMTLASVFYLATTLGVVFVK